LIGQSIVGLLEQAEQTFTGTSVLWLGESRL
jgi:protease-4